MNVANNDHQLQGLLANLVTIDSEYSRDLDDAIAVAQVGEHYHVVIAIANAANHTEAGSDLDASARNAAATSYARHRVLRSMLPRKISEDKATLSAGQPRDAVIFEILLSDQLEVVKFTPSLRVITVAHRISYDSIPQILESADDVRAPQLRLAADLSMRLLHARRKSGALALYDLKQMLMTDEEGSVQQLKTVGETIGQIIVQELMILGNKEGARFFMETDIPGVYRNHEAKLAAPPAEELATTITDWLKGRVYSVSDVKERMAIFAGKAKYDSSCRGHYALNLPAYAHFTSPLRRYADLLNQRQLIAFLRGESYIHTKESLAEISVHINETIERMKEERSQHYKNSARKSASEAMDAGRLQQLDDSEICSALKVSRDLAAIPDDLSVDINRRFDTSEITTKLAYCLLFEIPSSLWSHEIGKSYARWLMEDHARSISLLSAGSQIGFFQDFHFEPEIGQSNSEFSISAKVVVGNVPFQATASGAKKKVAEQLAATKMLCSIFGASINTPVVSEESQATTVRSAKSLLMEFCQQRKYPAPVFRTGSIGPSHLPIFSGSVTVQVGQETVEESSGEHDSKKKLEHALAEKMLSRLQSDLQQKQLTSASSLDKNPISVLFELAQKTGSKHPSYVFSHSPGASGFNCSVTVFHSGKMSFEASGQTKQIAKTLASQIAVDSGN